MTTETPVPPAIEAARRDVRLVGLLLLALIVVAIQPLPFSLAGIPFGVLAVVFAVRALSRLGRLRRAGGRPRGQLALSAGMGLAAVVTATLLAEAVTYPVAVDRERCLAGAVTKAAQQKCEDQNRQKLEEFLDPLYERAGVTPP